MAGAILSDQKIPPAAPQIDFRLLVESVRDYAIFMLDPNGYVTSWNTGAERINGYTADEIIGRHFQIFYAQEDIAAGRPELELATAVRAGRYEDEWWRLRKDGSRYRANVVVTPIHDAGGRLTGFAKVTRDVTERYQTEQALRLSEERFRILVEQISDYAVFLLDTRGRIATWNAGAQRIKGYTAKEAIGQSLTLFYTPEDVLGGKLPRLLGQAAAEGVGRDIGWRVRKDGSRFWADVTLTALYDSTGALYGYAKVVRDLTERVEAEEQRRAYEAAREAIRVRDEFLSIAAHELRTPLTAAQLQLQTLTRHVSRPREHWSAERLTGGLQQAIQSGERLSQLVETLLDVSRIATGRIRLEFSEFDLTTAAHDVVARLREVIDEAGCTVNLALPAPVMGRWDRLRVEQALMNLLSNACKYAPGTSVEVGVAQRGETARLWVRDTGPGIPPEHLDRIFGRFERAVSATNYGGLGLGLYVTRQIAEAHGGQAVAESQPGEGSTFLIELPLRPAVDTGA